MAEQRSKHEGAPWQALEEGAYHAYREWSVWLVLRERELGARINAARGTPPTQSDRTTAASAQHR